MGEKIENLDDPVARKNFRVVIIRPSEVEKTVLVEPDQSRRTRYTWNADQQDWTTEETWP